MCGAYIIITYLPHFIVCASEARIFWNARQNIDCYHIICYGTCCILYMLSIGRVPTIIIIVVRPARMRVCVWMQHIEWDMEERRQWAPATTSQSARLYRIFEVHTACDSEPPRILCATTAIHLPNLWFDNSPIAHNATIQRELTSRERVNCSLGALSGRHSWLSASHSHAAAGERGIYVWWLWVDVSLCNVCCYRRQHHVCDIVSWCLYSLVFADLLVIWSHTGNVFQNLSSS